MSAILLVDDEAPFRTVLREILEPLGHRLLEAGSGEEALERLGRMRIDLVIADQRMPGLDGLTLLRRIRSLPAPPAVVLLTAYGSIPDAVDAVRAGAVDYLTKPLQSPEELIGVVERALSADDAEIAGESARLREMIETADRVAEKDVPVLITGESGTGKELVARRIHRRSRRAKHAFVAVNCAALPDTLAESELFGHERGAFTGAERQRAGRFEEADRALVLRGSEPIRASDLALTPVAPTLTMSHDEVEKERVLEALRQAHGNRENAARLLGVSVRTLYYRLNRLGLD